MNGNEGIGTPSVLWIGGAQWCGKTSVSRILADRYGLQPYEYDYHDSRGHSERAARRPDLYPAKHRGGLRSLDEAWVLRTPEQMAAEDQAIFDDRFRMTIDDLSRLPPDPPVVAQLTGDRDPWLDGAREVHSALTRAGHDVSLDVLPGRGHSLGWEMRALTPEIVGRWLRRG